MRGRQTADARHARRRKANRVWREGLLRVGGTRFADPGYPDDGEEIESYPDRIGARLFPRNGRSLRSAAPFVRDEEKARRDCPEADSRPQITEPREDQNGNRERGPEREPAERRIPADEAQVAHAAHRTLGKRRGQARVGARQSVRRSVASRVDVCIFSNAWQPRSLRFTMCAGSDGVDGRLRSVTRGQGLAEKLKDKDGGTNKSRGPSLATCRPDCRHAPAVVGRAVKENPAPQRLPGDGPTGVTVPLRVGHAIVQAWKVFARQSHNCRREHIVEKAPAPRGVIALNEFPSVFRPAPG